MKLRFIKKLLLGFMIFSFCFLSFTHASGKEYEISNFVNLLSIQLGLTDTLYGIIK
ncbi:hypothetical protein [Candidatus Arthromitus sp. SFB-mouse-NL]|uniref:hypothetical protein n=1 Tax=Candidatus Arthromitus sp. SFB-mouse-NL TaxID=1508644 RepID=UPI0015649C06|nr:hypothetical protein [Candidatus Arthromitus sp. SFB-mouse-NL]